MYWKSFRTSFPFNLLAYFDQIIWIVYYFLPLKIVLNEAKVLMIDEMSYMNSYLACNCLLTEIEISIIAIHKFLSNMGKFK